MDSEKGLPHSDCLAQVPQTQFDKRKKLDVQRKLESIESESKYDLRRSLAWDSAFFTSPGLLELEELYHTLNPRDCEKEIDGCSIRRSLAWDSSFSTSEGVLNSEELCLVNKGFKRSEMHMLSGIEEQQRMSSESNCTVCSDGSSLSSLEFELFEDFRDSMNVLNGASGAVPKPISRHKDMQKVHSQRKMDTVPQFKMKSLLSDPKRKSAYDNRPRSIAKTAFTLPSRQRSGGAGESGPPSSIRLPKMSGRLTSVPLVANEIKGENKVLREKCGKSLTRSMKPSPGKTCRNIHSSPDHKCYGSTCRQFSTDNKASMPFGTERQARDQSNVARDNSQGSMCDEEMGTDYLPSDSSRSVKPSALRMPSPKIGFFEMHSYRTPWKNSNSGLQNAPSNAVICNKGPKGMATKSSPARFLSTRKMEKRENNRSRKIFSEQTTPSAVSIMKMRRRT